jgi:hypothetical protein
MRWFLPMPGLVSNADNNNSGNPIVTNHAAVEGIVPGRASEARMAISIMRMLMAMQ